MEKPKTEKENKEQILKFTKANKTVDLYEISNGLNMELGLVVKLCNDLMIEGKMGNFDYEEEPEDI